MSKIYKGTLGLIGNTPLVEVDKDADVDDASRGADTDAA